MSGIFGALGIADSERAFVSVVGQKLVFDAVNFALDEHNKDLALATSVFVERETEKFKMKYMLPGGGKLQEMGEFAAAAAVKAYGEWNVAFPLRQYGAQIGGSRVGLAYMTLQELDRHLKTVMEQDINVMRWRILTALFEDTDLSWTDPIHGSLTIRRLANTGGQTYPPVIGTESEADDDHYADTAYAISEITATNNPIVTLRDEIIEHFRGRVTGGQNLVVFHNADATAYLAAISGYDPIHDIFVREGDDTAMPVNWPNVPGWVHGRLSGCWLSQWAWIPATFMLAVSLDYPAPLMMRVDPAEVGLGRGLQLVAKTAEHPMESSHFEHRFGFGVGNRLNGAILSVTTSPAGTYAPPSAYAE